MQREFSLTPILINHQPLPSKMSWVKIFTYEPAEEEILSTRGKMYAVLSVAAKTELDFTPIMQLILEDIQKEYFEKTEGSILQALESALDGIHKKLILRAQEDKQLRAGFSFNLLTAVSWGTVLYFGQLGASRAGLVRHGKLYDIDEGEQKTTGLYLSSGTLEAGDRVVLTTAELFGAIDRQQFTNDLMLPVDQVAKTIEDRLGQGQARLQQSGIVLVVDIKQVPSPEEEGLKIGDPDQSKGVRNKGQGSAFISKFKGLGLRAKDLGKKLWGWKVGRTPALPLLVVGLAVVILVISMMWPRQGDGRQETGGRIDSILAEISTKQDEAESIAEVNADRALDLLQESEVLISQAKDIETNSQVEQAQARQLSLEDRVLQRQVLETTKLTSLSIDPSQAKLVWQAGKIYVVDSQQQQLVAVNEQGERQDLRISNRYSQGSLLTATDEGLILVSGGQAFVVDEQGGLSSAVVLNANLQAEAMIGYKATGYLLDRTGQVYRLPVQDGKIGVVSTYFNQVLSGTDFIDVVVDGKVYVLQGDGTLEVYLNGKKESVTWERADLIKEPKALLGSAESDQLLVWQDETVLVWTKQGKYLGQYRLADGKAISMVGIDDSGKSLYILSEGNLLKAEL